MNSSDDEDDAHFCLKCHRKIYGLDNYVAHRKFKCKTETGNETVSGLKADDFFSFLDLKSSKTNPPKIPTNAEENKTKASKDTEDSDSDEEPRSGGKWPPPGHTGGKWKPTMQKLDDDINDSAPPPEHTRGKWGPSEKPWGQLGKGSTYWCGPCNRRLSSKLVYDRHVKSELHFKRTNYWPTQKVLGKRKLKRTRIAIESSLKSITRRYKGELGPKKRRPTIICDVCNCRVMPHLMGKHLVSHFHCRHPTTKEISEPLILENIELIVRESPFQCALCKFYCNTQQTFFTHWSSDMHKINDSKSKGTYWCSFCKFSTKSSLEMGYHLVGEPHCDLVSLINHSVPIIIQKRIPLECNECSQTFRYNIQLKTHSRLWNHSQKTASEEYQECIQCSDCSYKAHSLISFQRHIRNKHMLNQYFCRKCNVRFNSVEAVNRHRRSTSHREACKSISRPCLHCNNIFPSLMALKQHLAENHPQEKHSCMKCGEGFLLKQELSYHVKLGKCVVLLNREHKCSKCDFSCDNKCDLIIHNVLHSGETSDGKIKCCYCDKVVSKASIKKHVQIHSEKAYSCYFCQTSFVRKDNLARHIARMHENFAPNESPKNLNWEPLCVMKEKRARPYSCSNCEKTFYDRVQLDQHSQLHFGKRFKCTIEGCIVNTRSEAELRIHLKTHSEDRNFHCLQCSYSSKTKGQLAKHVKGVHTDTGKIQCPHCNYTSKYNTHIKRHMRLHSGAKPYSCPHCSFACNLIENLRKHVINSKLHPNTFLYECKKEDCNFKTNFAKDFKVHLVKEHNEKQQEASTYIAGLYKPNKDVQVTDNPIPIKPKQKRNVLANESVELTYEAENAKLPTLASVALTPAKPTEDDVIFDQFVPEEDYDMVPFPSHFPIDNFTTQTHYDHAEDN